MKGHDKMKKIILIATAVVLLVCLVYQGSIAFFHTETQVGTKVSAGRLGINLVETSTHENVVVSETGYRFSSIMPGSRIHSEAYIENVKDKTLYVRVSAEKYWESKEGVKLPDANSSLITLVTNNPENWIVKEDEGSNGEIVYFYYRLPIKANEKSSNVLDAIEVSEGLTDKDYKGYQINVNLEAEAIQSTVAQDAVLSEWGIEIELDADGNIVSVNE